jgi:hypothetical protein
MPRGNFLSPFFRRIRKTQRHSDTKGSSMDIVVIGLGAVLWLLMALLVRGLERLEPGKRSRP